MSKERILVVDDEAGVRNSLQGILEDEEMGALLEGEKPA
jgi:DNA-binding NtrC family response regulator